MSKVLSMSVLLTMSIVLAMSVMLTMSIVLTISVVLTMYIVLTMSIVSAMSVVLTMSAHYPVWNVLLADHCSCRWSCPSRSRQVGRARQQLLTQFSGICQVTLMPIIETFLTYN